MLYAAFEPDRQEFFEARGHAHLFFEVCGNADGLPALFLHGGPGSGINANHRRFFDPQAWRILLFDQRGCGRSTPRGGIEQNTTADLVHDIEQLRMRLGVERWMLFGGSWGSTLALAYAQAHPDRVSGLVLRGVFLASDAEMRWYLEGLRVFMPHAWEALVEGISPPDAHTLVRWYASRVLGADREEALRAARRWSAYENAAMAIGEASAGAAGGPDIDALLDRMRVQLHYLRNDCFLAPRELLDGTDRIAHLPCVIVQGRRDIVCPPVTAYALHRRWPGSRLRMVEEGGHSAMHPAMAAALVQAVQDMRALVR